MLRKLATLFLRAQEIPLNICLHLISRKMKLNCSVTVTNRVLPNLSIKSSQKYKNAVLAIMKPPKDDVIYLLLITSKNKTGTRYKIRGNIEKTFGQFRSEGKTTIRFKEPPHDLSITADKIQLGNFMVFIKKVWNNEEKNVPEINQMNIPQVNSQSANKMEVKNKSDYPVLQGFPSNLQSLSVSNCQLKRVDNRILKLKSLTTLFLDKNNLTEIPLDLNKLPLKHLNLSHNKLGKNIQCWNFLSWPLTDSLEYLDLSGNEMRYFPASLVRFNKLKYLKLSNISVNRIPFRICLLPNLLELDLSRNGLLALPGTINRRHKQFQKLDISGNILLTNVNKNIESPIDPVTHYVPSLLEFSLRSTMDNRLPYNEQTLPLQLVPLLDKMSFCKCGKTCGKDFGPIYCIEETKSLANTFITSNNSFSVRIVYQACCPQHLHLKT